MRGFARVAGLVLVAGAPLLAMSYGTAISAAPAAPERPAADTARDADRKPEVMLAFAGVRKGAVVADLMPGRGYFTRLFSTAVGARGKVYAVVPSEFLARMPKAADAVQAIAATPGYGNVAVVTTPAAVLALPQAVDIAWTAQNYHDLYGFQGVAAAQAFDRAVYAVLRPGGIFVIEDHSALPGTSATSPTTLHRIDEAVVKEQVEAAGFVLVGESAALRNPADPRDIAIFAPAIRGHTDQFVLKFRKPGRASGSGG